MVILSNDGIPYYDGYCVWVNLPIFENKSQWGFAQISKKEETEICFSIKFFPNLEFQGEDPQKTADEYMNYYESKTGKRYLIDGYEVFGMLSPIVWKIWSYFYKPPILNFLNVIRLTQKIDIFDKIISEDHSGTIDSSINFGDFLISEEKEKKEEEED